MDTMNRIKPSVMLLTVEQAAMYLGLARSTLNKWRCHGGGPVFIKMGRSVRYRQADLEIFMSNGAATSTSSY